MEQAGACLGVFLEEVDYQLPISVYISNSSSDMVKHIDRTLHLAIACSCFNMASSTPPVLADRISTPSSVMVLPVRAGELLELSPTFDRIDPLRANKPFVGLAGGGVPSR